MFSCFSEQRKNKIMGPFFLNKMDNTFPCVLWNSGLYSGHLDLLFPEYSYPQVFLCWRVCMLPLLWRKSIFCLFPLLCFLGKKLRPQYFNPSFFLALYLNENGNIFLLATGCSDRAEATMQRLSCAKPSVTYLLERPFEPKSFCMNRILSPLFLDLWKN